MTTAQRILLVPKSRVIDAAPIACVLIMLAIPGVISPIIPVALLQVWLWLRHPRGRLRYLIALGVFALYFAITVGPPLFMYAADYLAYGETSYPWYEPLRLRLAVAIAAATGIVPILYRLVSRHSLLFAGEVTTAANSTSRGGIIDILFLSLFCAITFVSLRWDSNDGYAVQRVSQFVTSAICASVGAVFSLRFLARVNGMAIAVNFAAAWAGAAVTTVLFAEAERFVSWKLDESAASVESFSYTMPGYEWFGQWGDDVGFLFLLLLLPLFAIVNRCCGVILARPDRALSVEDKQHGFLSRTHLCIARLGIVALFGVICLAPVALANNGGLVAGWPLNYIYLESTPSYSLIGETEFDTLYFSATALIANIFSVALITLAIAPPMRDVSRSTLWPLVAARLAVLLGVALLMAHTCLIGPRTVKLAGENAVGSSSVEAFVGSPVPALFNIAEAELGWLPITDRRETRRLVTRGMDRETTEAALALPRLREVSLSHCQVSRKAIEQLRGSKFLNRLSLIECEVEKPIGSILETLPRLESLHVSTVVLPAKDLPSLQLGARLETLTLHVEDYGPLYVPEPIKFLTLIVPHDREQEIIIEGAANLETFYLCDTTKFVGSNTTRLRFGRIPKLRIIELDNTLKVDLAVADAPLLTTISDRNDTRLPDEGPADAWNLGGQSAEQMARLRRLSLSHTPYLKLLHIDFSEGQYLSTQSGVHRATRPVINDFLLNGRRGTTSSEDGRASAAQAIQIIRALARDFDVTSMKIRGVKVDRALIREISDSLAVTQLSFVDCRVADDAFDEARQFPNLTRLNAAAYSPNDHQFEKLCSNLPLLEDIDIDGSKLTTLPSGFAPQGYVYLRGADQLGPITWKAIGSAFSFMTFGQQDVSHLGLDLQEDALPAFWLAGESAGGKILKQLRRRATQGDRIASLILLSPAATKEDFHDYDWGSTERLRVVDARIDTATVKSWNLAGVRLLDLSRSDVSVDVLTVLHQKPHSLSILLLNDIADTQSPLPDLSQFSGIEWLGLKGRVITESDFERLIQSDVVWIDLEGCEFSAAVKERVARHQATGKFPELLNTVPIQE